MKRMNIRENNIWLVIGLVETDKPGNPEKTEVTECENGVICANSWRQRQGNSLCSALDD